MTCLSIGRHYVNLLNPLPEQIDIFAVDERLAAIRRFSGDPFALTVAQHVDLVQELAVQDLASPDVILWARHHDDHEAITGDIPGPLKALIRGETDLLTRIEIGLDRAICAQRGLPVPSDQTRAAVHVYDKQAETLEWLVVLGRKPAPWNVEVPAYGQRLLLQLAVLRWKRQLLG
jgi:hypothetical protein